MKVSIYHNILWSKYKGAVFSEIPAQSAAAGISARFVQIAETETDRVGLGGVDLSYHRYPYRLLFKGAYESVNPLRRALALAWDLVTHRSDLVILPGYHKFEYWAMLLTCIVTRKRRAVFCDSTMLDHPRGGWKERAKACFFSKCDGFFCYGSRSKEYLIGYGVDPRKIHFRCQAAALPHSYDTLEVLGHYGPSAPKGHRDGEFLYVGRLAPEKGIPDLLRALALLRSEGRATRLTLVGSGPERERLVALTETLGLSSAVRFAGSMDLPAIAELMFAADALVLPSHSEPWGLVVNESLSYGCPVVVSDACGCVPELVLEARTGFRFKTRDPLDLKRALLEVLTLSERRDAVARDCMQAVASFTPANAARDILAGCRELLAAGPAPARRGFLPGE